MKGELLTPSIPFEFFDDLLPEDICQKYKVLFFPQCAVELSKCLSHSYCTYLRCEKWCINNDLDDSMMGCNNYKLTFCCDCPHS